MNLKILMKAIAPAAALILMCSCGSSDKTAVNDGSSSAQNNIQTSENAVTTSVTSYVPAGSQTDKTDFSGLKSGKYAEAFAQQHEGTGYTLKWSYGEGHEDKPQNYIVFDGSDDSYALCLSQPAFNRNKFFVKDQTLYDVYDDDKDYTKTDMNQMAFEMGYLNADDFRHYVCDIFAGLIYLGSEREEINGKEYDYDAYYTDKQIELRLYTDENGELYAIKSISGYNEPCIMYVDEYSETCDRTYFEIPEGYTEYTE